MTNLSMKKLYMLAMSWIAEKESQGMSHEEAHQQVDMTADYVDFVWKNKAGKASSNPSKPQEAV
jgi:hypothetical protein